MFQSAIVAAMALIGMGRPGNITTKMTQEGIMAHTLTMADCVSVIDPNAGSKRLAVASPLE